MTASLRGYCVALLFGLLLLGGTRTYAQERAGSPSQTAAQGAKPEGEPQESDPNEAYRHSASVKKIGSMLGMNANQAATAFEVANFIVLAGLLGLVVLKTLPKHLRSRNTAIQKQLVDARTATEEASLRLSGVEERLAKLDEQIAAMRVQADRDSALDEQRIKASVEDEKKKLMAAAEQEIAAAGTAVRREIQQYAAELAIEQAARKLVVSAETDRLLVQGFARRLGGDDSKEGHN